MKNQQHIVKLSRRQREQLHNIMKRGKHNARVIKRARVLLESEQGGSARAVAQQVHTSDRTVERIRARFAQGGFEAALYDAPRPGQPRKLDDKAEKYLIALACTDPPEGADHWTLELLSERMIRDKQVKSISSVAIMHYLHRNDTKPWREKNVVHTDDHARVH